jgi:hypothetical protein
MTMPQPVTKHSCSEQWKPVTICEMKKFLGLMFLTGVIQKPKLEWYWSTRSVLLTPIFSQVISRNRFQIIHQYLHFNDSNANGKNEDQLYKIRPIISYLIIFPTERFHLMKACWVGGVICVFAHTTLAK